MREERSPSIHIIDHDKHYHTGLIQKTIRVGCVC